MTVLQEITNIVVRHTHLDESYLKDVLSRSPKMRMLFELIANDQVRSDKEACVKLYGSPDKMHNYRMVKSRLFEQLTSAILFVKQGDTLGTNTQVARNKCYKELMVARILSSQGATNAYVHLLKRALNKAINFNLSDAALMIARSLMFHYAVTKGDAKLYRFYSKLVRQYETVVSAESRAELMYCQVMAYHSSSQANLPADKMDTLYQEALKILAKFVEVDSLRFVRIIYAALAAISELDNRHRDVINYCHTAVEIIESKPFEAYESIFTFKIRLLSTFIKIRRFESAAKIALRYSSKFQPGRFNWYVVMYYSFILAIHSKNYLDAHVVLSKSLSHPKYGELPSRVKELWHINNAYAHFLVARGKITPEQDDEPPPFRIYKFLNEVPIYSRDKRGINISILIIHVLFLLHQRRFGKIIDRVDALNQYCYRHLRRDETFRSNCFIQMLIQVPKAGFNRIRTERYAEKYRKKLDSMPLSKARQGIEVEVFPYEHLWEMVLEMLK